MIRPTSPTRRLSPELRFSMSLPNLSPDRAYIAASNCVLRSSKGQKIEKLCGHSEWQPRFICVTEEKLLILHSEYDEEIADQIPLVKSLKYAPAILL